MYIRASAPEAPPFNDTTTGAFIRLFFWIAACIIRAIWSEAPPAPAATTISTGFVGSQAARAGALMVRAPSASVVFIQFRICFVPVVIRGFARSLRSIACRFKEISPRGLATFASVHRHCRAPVPDLTGDAPIHPSSTSSFGDAPSWAPGMMVQDGGE